MPFITDRIRDPGSLEVPMKPRMNKSCWVWTSPVSGQIKMNVDGSFLRVSSKGCIIRYLENNVHLQFGKKVRANSIVHTKVLALWEMLLVVAVSQWVCRLFLCVRV